VSAAAPVRTDSSWEQRLLKNAACSTPVKPEYQELKFTLHRKLLERINLEALAGIVIACVIAFAYWRIATGISTVGSFMGFVAALLLAAQPIKSLGTVATSTFEGLAAAERVYELLGRPTRSPYGNPIPGLDEFDAQAHTEPTEGERNLAFPGLDGPVVVSRICESVQTNADVLRLLHVAGVDPGARVTVAQERDSVRIDRGEEHVMLPREVASRVFVTVR